MSLYTNIGLSCMVFSNRARRALENRQMIDDDRLVVLEENLKQARYIAEERESMYEEVCDN